MRQDDLTSFIGIYAIYVAIVAVLVSLATNIVEPLRIVALVIFLLIPLLFFYIYVKWASFKKWFRVITFSLTRVKTFAIAVFIIVILLTLWVVFNIGWGRILSDVVTMNIIALDLVFALVFFLIFAGGIKIPQASHLLIRKRNDKVYLVRSGVIRWIPDPETFYVLGFSWDDVVEVNEDELHTYTERSQIESIRTAKLVKDQSQQVWYTAHDEKKRVPSGSTLAYVQSVNSQKIIDDTGTLDTLKETEPLNLVVPSVIILVPTDTPTNQQTPTT